MIGDREGEALYVHVEGGGDRPGRHDGHGAARARAGTAAAPATEGGADVWCRRQDHRRAARIGGRAGARATDRPVVRGHAAAARACRVDREGEALHVERGGGRPRPTYSRDTTPDVCSTAVAPATEGGAAGRCRRQDHRRAARIGGRAGARAADRPVVRGHAAAARPRRGDREGEALYVEGDRKSVGQGQGQAAGGGGALTTAAPT